MALLCRPGLTVPEPGSLTVLGVRGAARAGGGCVVIEVSVAELLY